MESSRLGDIPKIPDVNTLSTNGREGGDLTPYSSGKIPSQMADAHPNSVVDFQTTWDQLDVSASLVGFDRRDAISGRG